MRKKFKTSQRKLLKKKLNAIWKKLKKLEKKKTGMPATQCLGGKGNQRPPNHFITFVAWLIHIFDSLSFYLLSWFLMRENRFITLSRSDLMNAGIWRLRVKTDVEKNFYIATTFFNRTRWSHAAKRKPLLTERKRKHVWLLFIYRYWRRDAVIYNYAHSNQWPAW